MPDFNTYADDIYDLCDANPQDDVCFSARADGHVEGKTNSDATPRSGALAPLTPRFVASRLGEEAALFQANLMVRQCRYGDFEEAARTYNRFVGTFDHLRHPDLSLARVVKRLGREKARIVGVEKAVIDDAIRNWERYANLKCPSDAEIAADDFARSLEDA